MTLIRRGTKKEAWLSASICRTRSLLSAVMLFDDRSVFIIKKIIYASETFEPVINTFLLTVTVSYICINIAWVPLPFALICSKAGCLCVAPLHWTRCVALTPLHLVDPSVQFCLNIVIVTSGGISSHVFHGPARSYPDMFFKYPTMQEMFSVALSIHTHTYAYINIYYNV